MSGGGSGTQYFSLRWNNHPVNLVSVFTGLYQAESLVDVSLAAEGRHLQAHKVVLSACSDYFQALFAANPCQHPIVILKDVAFEDLQVVVKFMYHGIVNVSSDKLPGVLKTADALQIKGLEKNNELLSPYLGSPRLLPVPSNHGRQPSTESLPEYLHRSRSDAGIYPHRAHSAESRGLSFDSGPLEISRHKRLLSPPGSPNIPSGSSYARKKFRNRSDNESASTEERIEVERVKEEKEETKDESPALERSTSQYSSAGSGVSGGSDTQHIAKKKRAMFQALKGGSDSAGSKSSDLHNSSTEGKSDKENKRQESSLSSSQSISHSSDREETEVHLKDTLQVPGIPHGRTLVRAVSASELHHSALTTKFKRGRFLKRQQCQESAEEEAGVTKSEPPPSPPSITVNTAPLMKQISQPLLPSQQQSYSSPLASPPPEDPPCSPVRGVSPHPATARQPSLDPLCGLESVPLLYSSSGPGPRLPPSHLLRPTLPSVRVIPEQEPMHELVPHPMPSSSLLYPGIHHTYEHPIPMHQERKPAIKPRHSESLFPTTTATNTTSSSSSMASAAASRPPHTMEQFGHCPKARDGPALSCNFCWNTTDGSGRILRRKTKYHCPECQTNLCIVPCFQQFHEALEGEGGSNNQHH